MLCPRFFLRPLFTVLALLTVFAFSRAPAQETAAERRSAIEGIYPLMIEALETKNFGRARNICDQAIIWEPQNPMHHYNLACIEAQAGGDRLPRAFGALELAVALGFNDSSHLQNDPDLIPLHNTPRFAEIARKVTDLDVQSRTTFNRPRKADPATSAPLNTPPSSETTATPATASSVDTPAPAPAYFREGVPVGLFFMNRYWSFTSQLEKAAWYFAPDGTVFQNIEKGFSPEACAAHPGPTGVAKMDGRKLEITWSDGQKTNGDIERESAGFNWNMGIFTTVSAFPEAAAVVGVYEGGESLAATGDRTLATRRLELKADGTFSWDGVTFTGTTARTSRLAAAGSTVTTGRWDLNGYTLTLTHSAGATCQRIAFPYGDEKNLAKPHLLFFGGMMLKRIP
jgi:hypothetical protein